MLAEQGSISSVGIVPRKLGENKEKSIKSIAELLGVSVEFINNELTKSWVKDDSFVPIKEISYDSTELKQKLLQIPGIMINSKTDRVYPYKDAASHITGLTTGKLSENDEFNYTGLSWQKDSSWGDHKVTTLTAYNGKKNLENALIHSDNIYFAQAALKIWHQYTLLL